MSRPPDHANVPPIRHCVPKCSLWTVRSKNDMADEPAQSIDQAGAKPTSRSPRLPATCWSKRCRSAACAVSTDTLTAPFALDTAWQLHPQVSIRPKPFGPCLPLRDATAVIPQEPDAAGCRRVARRAAVGAGGVRRGRRQHRKPSEVPGRAGSSTTPLRITSGSSSRRTGSRSRPRSRDGSRPATTSTRRSHTTARVPKSTTSSAATARMTLLCARA